MLGLVFLIVGCLAQDLKKTKMSACLVLSRYYLEANQAELDSVIKSSKHQEDLVLNKMLADLLEYCFHSITQEEALKVISEKDSLEYNHSHLMELDLLQFNGDFPPELTDSQKNLFQSLSEMQPEPQPEVVTGPVFGWGYLLVVFFMIFGLFGFGIKLLYRPKPQKKSKKQK